MNAEELKTEFGLEFPTEIDGYKRPAEPLESGHDWFTEIPQLIAKDKVLYTGMNLILSALLSNEKLLKQWHDTLQNVVNAQDWRVVTDSLKGYMTPELKKKLDGIAIGANNYVHPSSHPATMITQDATHRFVTDTEKSTWNAKASTAVVSTTANGLMPKRNGNASYIFTGDGVWKSLAWNLITGKPSTFPPSTHNHDSSYLKRDNNNKNDLNSCTVEGIYRFSGTLTGGWTGTSWGTLLVLNNQYNGGSGISGTYLVQLAFPTDNTIRMRQRVNTGAWSSWVTLARTSDNITSATKATQDSRGQQIDTTYVKGVTGSNATLTVTKGNGTTSAVTINNVAHSTNADNAGKLNNKGDISASTLPNNFTTGLTTHSAYNGNYPSQYGNVININNKGKSQIFMEWKGDDNAAGAPGGIWYRECRDNQNAWSNWAKIAYLTDCTDTLKKVYPIGSIYMSTVSTNPATLFGFGTWEAMPAGRVLLAQGKSSWGTTYNAGSTGGEATHKLTVGELPAHNHSGSTNTTGEHTHTFTVTTDESGNDSNKPTVGYNNAGTYTTSSGGNHSHTVTINNTGSNQAHNNLQPYIAVYIWKRTA